MVALYPKAPLTAAGLSAYGYQAYAQHWERPGRDEVVALTHQVILADPAGPMARDDLGAFSYDTTLPVEALESIADLWMKEEPDNPLPAFDLAQGYERRNIKLEQAEPLAARAVEGMLRGLLRPYADPSGAMTKFWLPEACLLAARIELQLQHAALALGYARTAQSVAAETKSEAWLLEGKVWDALDNPTSAERAYSEAYRRGSKESEEALRAAYLRRSGAPDGFEAYLKTLASRPGETAAGKGAAPAFSVTTSDGNALDSAGLKGRVVVLNFWSTGCGPCKAEIPDLNRLVERFRTKDVVFLALTGEAQGDLSRFLEKTPFAYRIAPRAGAVFKAFGIDSVPVHVVVGRQGEVVARLTGASDEKAEEISRIVDRALAAGPP
jgi:thiol-disulfide isomerase/thioredoxin